MLRAYRDWARETPAAVTSGVRFLTPPPLPDVPEPVRGRPLMTITAAYAGDRAEGERLMEPMRALAPVVMDSFGVQPAEALCRIHGDPEQPVPGLTRGAMIGELDDAAIDALIGVGGAGSPLLQIDLRHLGGAAGEPAEGAGAVAHLSGEFAVSAVGVPMGPMTPETLSQALEGMAQALDPWATGLTFLNFSEQPGDGSGAFSEADYGRLKAVKAATDPGSVIRAGQEIAPTG